MVDELEGLNQEIITRLRHSIKAKSNKERMVKRRACWFKLYNNYYINADLGMCLNVGVNYVPWNPPSL